MDSTRAHSSKSGAQAFKLLIGKETFLSRCSLRNGQVCGNICSSYAMARGQESRMAVVRGGGMGKAAVEQENRWEMLTRISVRAGRALRSDTPREAKSQR